MCWSVSGGSHQNPIQPCNPLPPCTALTFILSCIFQLSCSLFLRGLSHAYAQWEDLCHSENWMAVRCLESDVSGLRWRDCHMALELQAISLV